MQLQVLPAAARSYERNKGMHVYERNKGISTGS